MKAKQKTDLNYLEQGNKLEKEGKWEEAIACYRQAIALNPALSEGYKYLGNALATLANKQLKEAISAYRQAIKINPNRGWYHVGLGSILLKQGKVKEAIACYQKAIEINPTSSAFYQQLGDALKEDGQLEEAVKNYYKAIDLDCDNVNAYYNLGLFLTAQKKWTSAIECFRETLKLNPDHYKAYNSIIYALEEQGNNVADVDEQELSITETVVKKFDALPLKDLRLVNSNNNLFCLELEPALEEINLCQPQTIPQGIERRFPLITKQDRVFVLKIFNGKVWGDGPNRGVLTAHNQLIREFSHNNPELVLSPLNKLYIKSFSPLEIDDTVAFLIQKCADTNYYHWMLQIVPQIGLLRRVGINIDLIGKFASYKIQHNFQKETLQILGISPDRLLEKKHHYLYLKAKQLIVTSPLSAVPQKWVCELLRDEFLNQQIVNVNSLKRIYISRRNASYRRVLNEEELISCLEKLNVTVVTLETLPVREQAALFSKTEVVIAPHGAGLTNIVFCSPGTKVIEIFAPSFAPPMYQIISNYCSLKYYYLIAEDANNPNSDTPRDQHLTVNLNSLLELMKLAAII
ncbi:MAG: DUF563 domain-containing protein [Gomphosphaeria aponina SAG 52.96 = DSM 107014]|uniref:DUF563 domain-containing protein n=1 Tax=Gomphosphaeria aponina SAG 52.96 = DSM 107014 TaxID=1521640 RepID=A0A941JP54_9CHRO|nr:DUF563 domain-containing protein [Gomphosphaeria aponina SAG 52.96 = DSM 107014]